VRLTCAGTDSGQGIVDLPRAKESLWLRRARAQYVDLDPSQERLAGMVLKREREVYGIRRPRQPAERDVCLRIGEPIDPGRFVASYLQDARAARHEVAEQLRDVIRALVDAILTAPAGARYGPPPSDPHRPRSPRGPLLPGGRPVDAGFVCNIKTS
jgi:hypothetical protein